MRFDAKNSALNLEIDSLEAANADMSAKLQELTGNETPLQKAQSLNKDLISDTDKFEKHISSLKGHRTKVSDKLQAEQKESLEREGELTACLAQIEEFKLAISKQELTPSDVQRMNSDNDSLKQELASLKAQKDELNKQLWEEDSSIARGIDKLEAKAQQANNSALRLLLIPAEAKNAGGVSHQIDLQKHLLQSEPWRLLSIDPTAVIKPSLVQLKGSFSHDFKAAQDAQLEAEDAQTQRDEEKQQRGEELQQLKAVMQRLELEEKLVRLLYVARAGRACVCGGWGGVKGQPDNLCTALVAVGDSVVAHHPSRIAVSVA